MVLPLVPFPEEPPSCRFFVKALKKFPKHDLRCPRRVGEEQEFDHARSAKAKVKILGDLPLALIETLNAEGSTCKQATE